MPNLFPFVDLPMSILRYMDDNERRAYGLASEKHVVLTLTVTISDNNDPSPTADLVVTWEDESDPAQPLTELGGNTYQVEVTRSELVGSRIDFFVRGTLADTSGNARNVDLTDDCIIID